MAKIVAGQTPAVGLSNGIGGGHDLWALFDDSGNMVQQINGFALVDGAINTTALSGTLVATFEYRMPDFNASSPQVTVLQGTMDYLAPFWNAAKDCATQITAHNFEYSWSSQNSNSVYSTVAQCMNVAAPDVGAWYTVTPGLNNVLLTVQEVSSILIRNNIGNKPKIPPPPGADSHSVEIQLVAHHDFTPAMV